MSFSSAGLDFFDTDDWDKYTDIIQYTYNNISNSMTSYPPNDIVFGKSVNSPLDIKKIPYTKDVKNFTEYIKYMDKLRKLININANIKQHKYDRQRTKSYNKNLEIELRTNLMGQN